MMSQLRRAQAELFRLMDRQIVSELSALETGAALNKYAEYAAVEGSCRDVAPSPELSALLLQLAQPSGKEVSDDLHRRADAARNTAAVANDKPAIYDASRLWNQVLWSAPWWNEPFIRTAELLDKLGRPQEAADLGRRALELPAATPVVAAVPANTADSAPAVSATAQSLSDCIGRLAPTDKGSDSERRQRHQCAQIAGRLTEKPDIPEDARRHFARGEAALELGQSQQEFDDSASEFESALHVAPWWPEAHRNLAKAYEKSAKYQLAISAYNGYLAAAPAAADQSDIRSRIYKLEYAADRDQKQTIQRQMQDREATLRLQGLVGTWVNTKSGNPYRAIIQDNLFVASRTPPSDRTNKFQGDYVIKGVVKGNTIEGTFTDPPIYNTGNGCTTPVSEMPLTGTISADARTMTLTYKSNNYQSHGIRGNLFNLPKCTSVQKVSEQTIIMILQKQ